MTRTEIIAKFRQENPEITDRVLTDAVLYTWCEEGNLEIAIKSRCIVGETTFDAIVDVREYDVTDSSAPYYIENFFEVDEYPGGGVCYDDERVEKSTIAELDMFNKSWRSYSSGTPERYYRRGSKICFDRAPDDDLEILVYSVLKPDAFNDADLTPFNGLTNLEPFHYSINLYLQKRAKMKIGKSQEEIKALQEFDAYVKWMATTIGGAKWGKINFIGSSAYQPSR